MNQSIGRLLLFAFILILNIKLFAQTGLSSTDKKAIQYFSDAGLYNKRAMFPEAIGVLEKAIKRDPNFLEALIMAGVMHEKIYQRDQAVGYYESAIKLAPELVKTRKVYLTLASLLMKSGDYTRVQELMQKFLSMSTNVDDETKLANQYLASAEFSLFALANPVSFTPQPLPDLLVQFPLKYFPAVTVDGKTLIFTAREGNQPYHDEDIFVSKVGENGNWLNAKPLSDNINTTTNEGACTISADGRILIFTSCQGRNSLGSCDLYISTKQGDLWSKPNNLGSPVNSKYWESQPSLSADGRTLYFVSNRPGGYGKRDLWMSSLNDQEKWTEPVNLGADINTADDDISPFIHFNSQNLYFASQGHPGLGGFDLYMASRNEGKWGLVRNLGYPINDLNDQISLFINAEGNMGYYADERMQGGQIIVSNLVTFEIPKEVRVEHRSNFLTGKVRNKVTNEPVEAELKLLNIVTGEEVSRVKSDVATGEYFVVLTEGQEYGIFINKPGYLFQDLNFNYTVKDDLTPEVLDIYLDPISIGAETVLQNLFFASNAFELESKSESELKSIVNFLTVNPTLAVEISGHTDNTGSDKLNLELSQKRAKSVYDYLLANGISSQRVTFQGYGSKRPLDSNETEEGKARNRRISFSIIKY